MSQLVDPFFAHSLSISPLIKMVLVSGTRGRQAAKLPGTDNISTAFVGDSKDSFFFPYQL